MWYAAQPGAVIRQGRHSLQLNFSIRSTVTLTLQVLSLIAYIFMYFHSPIHLHGTMVNSAVCILLLTSQLRLSLQSALQSSNLLQPSITVTRSTDSVLTHDLKFIHFSDLYLFIFLSIKLGCYQRKGRTLKVGAQLFQQKVVPLSHTDRVGPQT